jgi:acyl-CoA dehydrogenase
MSGLDYERVVLAGIQLGIMQACLDVVLPFVRERKQFGQALAQFQLIQGMIADMKTEAMAARALVLEGARKRDAGQNIVLEAAAAKYFASEMVGRVADKAVQIFGGAGYVADYGIERLYRDVRIFRIYEGTSQVQQIVIARETMKRGG